MSITATFDHRARRVIARATGQVTLEDIRQHLEEERQEPGLSYSEIFDARGAIPEFAPSDVRVIVAFLRWLGEKTKLGPTAVVVDSDLAYGMVRMVEMLVEDVCAVKPFRSESEAESWLDTFSRR
jgi:hypothetical protein